MTIIRGSKIRGFILAAAFSAGLGFATSASAQIHSYLIGLNSKVVTQLGTLGSDYVYAYDINDASQVVRNSITAEGTHAFITGPDGAGMRDLGSLGSGYSAAYGINEAGQVAGSSFMAGGGPHAFITGPNGHRYDGPEGAG
jgi:probable HAF family extracellular repeat protein